MYNDTKYFRVTKVPGKQKRSSCGAIRVVLFIWELRGDGGGGKLALELDKRSLP